MGAVVIGALRVDLGLETAAFSKGASQASKDMAKMRRNLERQGKALQGFGRNMSLFVTAPVVAFGVKAREAAIDGRDALAQIEAGLESMGGASGKTSAELQQSAKELEKLSTFDDKEILRQSTANLLTFGNIANEQFDRANLAAVDMSTRLEQDLSSSAIMLGKALNDPKTGLTALTRVGITFTDEQKNMIVSMQDAGDIAGAQTVILEELEKQFAGSGKAARDAAPGSDEINKWSDLKEQFGELVLQLEERIVPVLGRVMSLFTDLSPEAQKFVAIAALMAAALGPVAFVIGSIMKVGAPLIALIGSIAKVGSAAAVASGASATGFTALSIGAKALLAALAPIAAPIAAVAAAGALIYANWGKISPVLEKLRDRFNEVLGPKLQALVEKVQTALTELWEGPLGEGIRKVIGFLGDFSAAYLSVFGEALVRVLSAALDIVTTVFDQIGNVINLVVALLTGDWAGAWQAAKDIVVTMINGTLAVIESLAPGAIDAVARLYRGVKQWIQEKLGAIFNWLRDKIEAVSGYFEDLYVAVVGNSWIPDMVDGIGQHMARLQGNMVKVAEGATKKTADAFERMADEVSAILARLFPEQQALIDYKYERNALEEWAREGRISAEQLEKALGRLRRELRETLNGGSGPAEIKAISEDEPIIDQEAFDREMDRFNKEMEDKFVKPTKAATADLVVAFADMAGGAIGAIDDIVRAFKSGDTIDAIVGILDLIGSLVQQLGSIGVFGGNSAGFQFGGVLSGSGIGRSFGGPVIPGQTYRVGERGPELLTFGSAGRIIPNDALQGGAYFDLRGAAAGRDMAIERINKRNRQRLGS